MVIVNSVSTSGSGEGGSSADPTIELPRYVEPSGPLPFESVPVERDDRDWPRNLMAIITMTAALIAMICSYFALNNASPGLPGPQGPRGIQGIQGPAGAQGIPGTPGRDGTTYVIEEPAEPEPEFEPEPPLTFP